MSKRTMAGFTAITAVVLVLALLLAVSPVAAARDRTPPTTPANLRVTGMTAYSVSLAWDPSTDKSGSVTYTICCANVSSETFPGPASTHVYRAGLEAARSFTLSIIARDAAGNYSNYSNPVTFTLPADTIPPTQPIVSLTDVGPTHVSLAWSSIEDGPNVWFSVFMDGNRIIYGTRETSGTSWLLEPETTHTFTVQAQDFGNNLSPLSEPITVTTAASDPNDVTPPTPPTNLSESHWGDGEIHVTWTQSTDNVDEQSFIRYDVYVNDVLSDITVGSGFSIVYSPGTGNLVTVTIIAVDTAGNASDPASITIDMNLP